MRDMAEHGMHRRQVAGAYATSSLHRYEPMVDRNIENLLAGLEKQRKSGIWKVDIARWAYYCMEHFRFRYLTGLIQL